MATYTDYKLDVNGDRVIESGAFVFIEDKYVIQQQIETNIRLSKKDWFLNFDEGIQYFSDIDQDNGILGTRILNSAQEGQIQAAVENTVGVIAINKFEIDFRTTELIIYIEALTEFGQVTVNTTIGT